MIADFTSMKAKLVLCYTKYKKFQQMPKIHKDHVSEYGDTIEEINTKSGIGELLYQGDIVLTE